MRDPPVQPGQGRALERPPDGDPLVLELQRNRDGRQRERGAGDERQPGQVALARALEPQQAAQQHGGDQAEHHRHDADDRSRSPPASNASRPAKNAIAVAPSATSHGSRPSRSRGPAMSAYAQNTA